MAYSGCPLGRWVTRERSEPGGRRSRTAQLAGGGGNFNDRVGQLAHSADEKLDDSSVKLGIGATLQLGERVRGGPSLLVGAVAGNGIVGVGDSDDASA